MHTLPDYFLADLPPGTVLQPQMIVEACQTLRRNRERYLAGRSTAQMISFLSTVAESWLDPDYHFRQRAIKACDQIGFPSEVLNAGLDKLFSAINPKNLRTLILQDLGHLDRLDQFCSTEIELAADRAAWARAPELITHISSGNIPNSGINSLILGLLLRSAQFVKASSGSSTFLRLFAHSIYEAEPKLASCIEIAEWKGGMAELEDPLIENSDLVTITGSNETISDLRHRYPSKRIVEHGHRVSFAYIGREALQGSNGLRLARAAAADVAAWNQQGCLSPHIIYVEHGGSVDAAQFGALLADALILVEETHPRGVAASETAGNIAARRSFYEMRAAFSERTKIWTSKESTAWTVVFEADPLFQHSCLDRFIYVKAAASPREALEASESVRGKVSTVALESSEDRLGQLSMEFAKWGATRICRIGKMQEPPLSWRHDGRPSLGELVTWTDWERS